MSHEYIQFTTNGNVGFGKKTIKDNKVHYLIVIPANTFIYLMSGCPVEGMPTKGEDFDLAYETISEVIVSLVNNPI